MLTQEIKKKIDSARDILVGKVPDPKAQVEQITTALIYKFMDDMDKQAQSLPKGKAQFFTNGFEKYAWGKMMDAKLGGQERLNLYVEAIAKMAKNPHLPQLFRDVFKDAFLPYRDPETLNLFLKDINTFSYDHSENLGDAFEYLLSILGSQGDAGQFRTPRHIIDFIVEVVDPKKDETILDPACGTAGFLISAYKHILKSNKNKPLTPDEKKRLMGNLAGYDISPDMVKLSLVNMYLHGFPSPNIHEYDTLSSEEKWGERFDVMMANPPFMTPTGGIRPHKRFMVQANRAEVLFVDYIMEHLNNKGRAGIIVPEGIIFQSAGAYKQLRKSLVEDGLYAVVSLPGGVFSPYSGVKTSILFFDNQLAKQSKEILFVKVLNDGFDLGAQRRPVDRNDLPHAVEVLQAHSEAIKNGKKNLLLKKGSLFAWAAPKDKIIESGDYNLSGDRYNRNLEQLKRSSGNWPMVELGTVCSLMTGGTPKSTIKKYYENGTIKWLVSGDIHKGQIFDCEGRITESGMKESNAKILPLNSVLIALNGQGKTRGAVAILHTEATCNQSLVSINPKDKNKLLSEYLFYVLKSQYKEIRNLTGDDHRSGLNMPIIRKIKIPLPPLEVQKEIVEELYGYQKVIDGAKQIIAHHKPSIKIDPKWKIIELESLTERITKGTTPTTVGFKFEESGINFIKIESITEDGRFLADKLAHISKECHQALKRSQLKENDILFSIAGAFGRAAIVDAGILPANTNQALSIITLKLNAGITKDFLFSVLKSDYISEQTQRLITGVAQFNLSLEQVGNLKIPLPPTDVQEKIVAITQEEQRHIESAERMIEIYERKIKSRIAEVWGE